MAPRSENKHAGGGQLDRLHQQQFPASVAWPASRDANRRVTFTQASMIEPEIVRWLWEGREAVGA